MTASFVVYIDESGDEGFNFGGGSTEWFVLSAVITRKAEDVQIVKLVDDVRVRLGREPKKPLHFRDIRHEHRLPYLDAIARADLRVIVLLIHKPSTREPQTFQARYRLYFSAVRSLLERVCWYCRDQWMSGDDGDGSADIVFSNRSDLSYEELKDYVRWLQQNDTTIGWSTINSGSIEAFTPGRRMGLQIADAVASGFFYAVERSRYGFIEDRYVRMLRQVVYQQRERFLGYGIMFWPPEAEDLIASQDESRWLRENFP